MDTDYTADEAAIRAIVQSVQDAWNAGDGTGFAAPFAEDADFVIVTGNRITGREAIRAGHEQILSTFYRGSQNQYTVESIRFLRPDVAIALVHAQLRAMMGDAEARQTWVLAKDGGQWQVAAFQNTEIKPQWRLDPASGESQHS